MEEDPRLVKLWQELADHTKAQCGAQCYSKFDRKVDPDLIPTYRCCAPEYCRMAKEYAKERFDVDLQPTGHPTLLFMGPGGCTVAPHHRPICSLHQCLVNSLGGIRKDPEWTRRYFELCEAVEELDWEVHGATVRSKLLPRSEITEVTVKAISKNRT